ncbi:MAG: class I SAM-dependent methyltransferase [Anaerolineae bacterium]|nr:class I SAM-dependent methyltransferase [Anaerolineae bacterium]
MTDLPAGTQAWQSSELTANYLNTTRAALPLASEQLDVMLYVIGRATSTVTSILDLGAGSGTLSQVLLARYPDAHTTLVDYSDPMLDSAKQNFAPEQATIIKANMADPDWQSALATATDFDVIVSGYAIHHLPDTRKRSLYAEIFHLLKPGGIFVNVEHVSSPTPWVESLFTEAFADNLYQAEQSRGGDMTRETILERLYQDDGDICAPVESQCTWLRKIGFQDVDCYIKIYALAVFGGIKPA